MSDELKTDVEAAVRFLEWKRPGGPWPITVIAPDGGATPTTWLQSADEVRDFVRKRSGRTNLFYTVAEVRPGVDKKPRKADVVETRHLHADLDPPKDMPPADADRWVEDAIARVRASRDVPPPNYIGRSGNGLHLLWALDEPFFVAGAPERIADVESYTLGLVAALDADKATFNVDRLLRLPGTINLPDTKKIARGREPRPTSIVELNDGVHSLADFRSVTAEPSPGSRGAAGTAKAEARGDVRRLDDIAELDQWGVGDDSRYRMLVVQGHDPDDFEGDRSKVVFNVCCEFVRRGVPSEIIVGVLTDATWGISAHVREAGKRDVAGYAWRQVERARVVVAAGGEAFQTDKDGKPYANPHNIRLALSKMGVRVRFDTFADRPLLEGLAGFGPHLDDAGMTRLWLTMDEEHRLKVGKDFCWAVVEDAARRDAFHPVVEYLAGLSWDGVERLDRWMTTHLGADDSEYTRHVGAIMLTAAVKRVRQPGCKFDEMVVLESEQGKSKSTALSILAVREEWFSDDLPLGAESKVVIERTQGRFIIEAGELAGMSKKSIETLKAFQSRRIDRSRMAYGRLPHEAPRHFIVVGTTNDDKYLSDSTGNRRFWPVRVGDIDLEALARDRDQLWAEAAAREAAGASIRLDRALWQAAAVEQEDRRVVDPFVHVLADVFRLLNGKVPSRDVWAVIGTPVGLRTPQLEARLGSAMRELGFKRSQKRFGGNPEGCYVRGTKEEQALRIRISRDLDQVTGILGPWLAAVESRDGAAASQLFADDPY